MKLDFHNATEPFAGLPDISEVEDLNAEQKQCLSEVRNILCKHGLQSVFGVMRLHSHFEVASDEVLIEECDEARRTLTIRPLKKDEVSADRVIETNWRLDTREALMGCSQYCVQSGSSHGTQHAGV